MTATAGAPSTKIINWKTINWSTVENQVSRLQLRIAKAIKIGRYSKAKALQWLLTHSFSQIKEYLTIREDRLKRERINSRIVNNNCLKGA
jgi:N-terminal domain of reverse transcriptase